MLSTQGTTAFELESGARTPWKGMSPSTETWPLVNKVRGQVSLLTMECVRAPPLPSLLPQWDRDRDREVAEQQKTAGDLLASAPGSTQAPLAWGDSEMGGLTDKVHTLTGWRVHTLPGWERSVMADRTWSCTG